MSLGSVVKSGLLTLVMVVVALAVWILIRSGDLVRLSVGLDPSILTPENQADAFTTGLIIWTPIAIILCFISAITYWFVATRWRWRRWHFALIPIGLAVLVSVAAFAQNMAFKVEATGEVMIVALGYGVLMPLLARQSERAVAPGSHT